MRLRRRRFGHRCVEQTTQYIVLFLFVCNPSTKRVPLPENSLKRERGRERKRTHAEDRRNNHNTQHACTGSTHKTKAAQAATCARSTQEQDDCSRCDWQARLIWHWFSPGFGRSYTTDAGHAKHKPLHTASGRRGRRCDDHDPPSWIKFHSQFIFAR